MNNANLIDNAVTGDRRVRQAVKEFIDSINFDLTNRIKRKGGSQESSADEKNEEEPAPNFSNRKLIFKDETFFNYYSKTQKWLGHITEINPIGFKARLEDLTQKGTLEYGEFEIDEVSEEDRSLIQIGAAFYWSIGFSHEKGQITKNSLIRFQRVLQWDEKYMNNAADRADHLAKKLKWE